MTDSHSPSSAESAIERTGHCPLCWTYSKSDDYCSSFEEAIASTAERPMGCPWFTSEDRANWRARHKSSDGEPSNGKQPLMASRPAPPVPSDQSPALAQSSQVTAALELARKYLVEEGDSSSVWSTIDNVKAVEAIDRALAAQPSAAPVETDAVEGDLDTIVQLIHKHVSIRQRVNVDLTGIEDAAKAIIAALRPRCSAGRESVLLEIIGHLGAILVQTIPSDDQIIIDHVRQAHDLARELRRMP